MEVFDLADGKTTPSILANQHNIIVLTESIHGKAKPSYLIDDYISSTVQWQHIHGNHRSQKRWMRLNIDTL